MTVPIRVNNNDPNNMSGPARTLAGPVQTGAVTLDQYFGEGVFGRWIYVGTSGDLGYTKYDGTTETLPNLAAGIWHPIPAIKINTTGTNINVSQLRWGS